MSMTAIDLFAGAGGFSMGAEMAGVDVVWAANHWRAAVETHKLNHPGADAKCQDLQQADWSQVPAHDVFLASPACQGHSRAKGKEKPHSDLYRNTAWAVVSCLEHHRTPLGLLENVVEFRAWELYSVWCDALKRLGYSIAEHVIDSADHGVPQNRVRLILVISRSRSPIKLTFEPTPHKAVASVLNWSGHRWNPIQKPNRAVNTLSRIASGRAEFGDRFTFSYYGNTKNGRSLDRPIGTLTTKDRWALVDGDRMRMVQVDEQLRIQGFPDSFILPSRREDAVKMIGNAVAPPVARDLLLKLKEVA